MLESLIGQQIGSYRILRLLGKGGMGAVYEAEDIPLQRRVALKWMFWRGDKYPIVLTRFLREARVAAQIHHPRVVSVLTIDQHDEHPFLVLELMPGGSLSDELRNRGPMLWPDATAAIIDACEGMAAAHGLGILHRDLKPSNLLRGLDGHITVADFGLVKLIGTEVTSITDSGQILGTPTYMSPEQCRAVPVNERSDVYALGATYYTLLTAAPPFPVETPLEAMFAHCNAPRPDPRALQPHLPAECTTIVQRAMAIRPEDRYANVNELLQALRRLHQTATTESALSHTLPITITPSDTRTIAYESPRLRGWVAGILLTMMIVVVVLAWFFIPNAETTPSTTAATTPTESPTTTEPITLRSLRTLATGSREVRGLAFAPDGRWLVAAGDDGNVYRWEVPSGDARPMPSGHQHPVWSIGVAPDGKTIFSGDENGQLIAWNSADPRLRSRPYRVDGAIFGMAISPRGDIALALANSGWCVLQHLGEDRYKTIVPVRDADHDLFNAMAFSTDGEALIVVGMNRAVQWWETRTWTEQNRITWQRNDRAYTAAVDPGNRSATIGFTSGEGLRQWYPDRGQLDVLPTPKFTCTRCVQWLPNRRVRIHAGTWDGSIHVEVDGQERQTFIGSVRSEIRSMAINSTGTMLATGSSENGMIELWEIALIPR